MWGCIENMARPLTTLAIFFVAFNLLAGVMMAQGIAADIGIEANVGENQSVNERVDESRDVASGAPTGQTLFGMYNVLTKQIGNVMGVIFPGLTMLERAGVPNWITQGILGTLFSLVIFVDVLSFIRGYSL